MLTCKYIYGIGFVGVVKLLPLVIRVRICQPRCTLSRVCVDVAAVETSVCVCVRE